MSPFLKALGIGIAVFVVALLIMWAVSRALNRPFFPQFPRGSVVSPTPVQPVYPTE